MIASFVATASVACAPAQSRSTPSPPSVQSVVVAPRKAESPVVEDAAVEAKPLELRDAEMAVRSVRLVHPSRAVREAVKGWLEPFEREALGDAKRSLECHAGIVDAHLVSVRCVRFREWEPDPNGEPGMQGGSTEPVTIARTWRIDGGEVGVVDEIFVDEEANVARCSAEATCESVEPPSELRAFVRRHHP